MLKTKIRNQFLSLLMVVGLIPLIIIGALFYFQSAQILLKNSFRHISAIQDIKSSALAKDIEGRFSLFEELTDGDILSNMFFMIDNNSSKDDLSFLYDNYFAKFIQTNAFYNIFILSKDSGDILYSYKNEKGSYDNSGLSRVWKTAMFNDSVVMEDFDSFAPSSGMQSAFLGKKWVGADNEVKGVVVLQITNSFINSILKSTEGMGETGESYLISYDLESDRYRFKSNMKTMGDGLYSVGYVWKSKPLEYWIRAVEDGIGGGSGNFLDSSGNRVLVNYSKLDIPWLNWYLISKIDRNEVLSSLTMVLKSIIWVGLIINIIIGFLSLYFSKKLTAPIVQGAEFAREISTGNYNSHLDIDRKDELGLLAKSLKEMGRNLDEQSWIRKGKEGLDNALRGEHDINSLGNKFITFLVMHLDAQIGALYLLKDDDKSNLYLNASYSFSDPKGIFKKIAIGEGLVGQSALENREIVYTHIPSESPELHYGVGSVVPTCYVTVPLSFEGTLLGVFLIGITVPVTKLKRRFISEIKGSVSILINSAKSSSIIQDLLEDTQLKQEELRVSNEELEQQTIALKDSEKDLQAQQEELRVTNEELQERTGALERQREIMKDKNRELALIGRDLKNKAEDLEKASRYKSEFLANMSHELRTPLNSILILSQLLANNKKGNLDEKQIQSSKAINSSGEDLLHLINQILDLSKVEAGKIEIHPEVMTIESLIEVMERLFRATSEEKGLDLKFQTNNLVPKSIITDPYRLQQVIKNLLTNAIKFTDKGGEVSLNISKIDNQIQFSVKDSGIGIAKDNQDAVFEAFKQADGSTSRVYGGTGLGLSISRELTKLLDGKISLESELGKGSTFSVTIPIKEGSTYLSSHIENREVVEIHVKDDRSGIEKNSNTLLIVEDDVSFTTILKDKAHDRGYKVLIAEDGETGLYFADYYRPCGIILDIGLPGIDGFTVLERLKNDPELNEIPVYIITGSSDNSLAMEKGAVGFMQKPIDNDSIEQALDQIEKGVLKSVSNLLIIEDDELQRDSLYQLIDGEDVDIIAVGSGSEALQVMGNIKFDCVILDLGLEDMSGYEFLNIINENAITSRVPIIIYTGKDLTLEEDLKLKQYAKSIIIKGIKSPERLIEESSIFLNRVHENRTDSVKKIAINSKKREEVLAGKNILVVDDDMRNIFALSKILEDKDINVIIAKDGIESLEIVNSRDDIDLILMDIMMPRMDGYEAINKIREIKTMEEIPIIALTANAMKGDRNKCIDAGANDYLAKPIDNSKLISMLRVWLYT